MHGKGKMMLLVDLVVFLLAVLVGYLLRHVQNLRRTVRSLNRAKRALDQPCEDARAEAEGRT